MLCSYYLWYDEYMKKLTFLIFLLFCFILTGCSEQKQPESLLSKIKSRDKIIVGIKTDSKPFGFIKNGEITGFDADIAYAVARKIFLTDFKGHVEFIPLKPSERISALNTGKVDVVIATLSINDRRKEVIDFSIPYYVTGQALMVPKYSKIKSVAQLNDKSVAIILGTTGERTIRLLAPNANAIGAISYPDAFNHLKEGHVEAVLADDSLLYGLVTDNKGYKILPARYTEEYYAIGIRKGEDTKSLKKLLDITIRDIQQNGKLNRIKEKWIPGFQLI